MKKINFLIVVLTIAFMVGGLCYADLDDGLMAYYPFSGNANDESLNDNDGKVNGASLTNDRHGHENGAYYFDGVDDFISVQSHPSLNPSNQLSIAIWLKIESFKNHWAPIIHKGEERDECGRNREYAVWLFWSSLLEIASAGDDSCQHFYQTSSGLPVNEWIFYVAVVDRLNHSTKAYINGSLNVSATDSFSSFYNCDCDMRIGNSIEEHPHYSPFNGMIDEIRLYNRVLSEEEIQQLYTESPNLFSEFNMASIDLNFDNSEPNNDSSNATGDFTLAESSDGINLISEEVIFKIGTSQITIPSNSFWQEDESTFKCDEIISDVTVQATFEDLGSDQWAFGIRALSVDLTGTSNPDTIMLKVGNDWGEASERLEGILSLNEGLP